MKYIRPRSQPPSKLLDKRCEAGGGFVCDKGQLQVVEDAVDYRIIGDEGDDVHLSLASGADKPYTRGYSAI